MEIIKKDVTVILDYGHGGISPITGKYVTKGKRSPKWTRANPSVHNVDIYYEGEGNREIGLLIEEELKTLGINFLVTAKTYLDLPLKKRCKTANKIKSPCFLISIHSNAGGGTSAEIFTSPGDTPADPMATISYEEFKKEFPEYAEEVRTDYRDGDPDKEARFTMLTDTNMPAFVP